MITHRTLEQASNKELSETLAGLSEQMHRPTIMEEFLMVVHEMSFRLPEEHYLHAMLAFSDRLEIEEDESGEVE